ncbi:MAG TPA: ATP-binding cassette domain-containing protein [Acidimicrobiales bacterium]|nr:ATP-binding cassette domain-containing protein [Acidimicrobiales bacterium]
MTADVVARCEGAARTFGHGTGAVVAVHDATCRITAGERIALTGPSGSGKSTLLHLLAGLDEPTAGRVDWPALGPRRALRPGPVAVVFQAASLLPALDGVENVALPLVLAGADEVRAQAAALAALERLGLDDLARKLPEELSGGQAQRVAVARALVGRPRLLLADEPTGQLDHGTGAQVVDALVDTAEHTGCALLVTTHDPAVAERLAERWHMVDGRLQTTETTETTDTTEALSWSA